MSVNFRYVLQRWWLFVTVFLVSFFLLSDISFSLNLLTGQGWAELISVIFSTLSNLFFSWGGWILDTTVNLTITNFKIILDGTGAVDDAWAFVRNAANVLIIIMFLFTAIGIIVNFTTFNAKKQLIALIVVAILVNFSGFFTRVLIDISNITTVYLINTNFGSADVPASAGTTAKLNLAFGGNVTKVLDSGGSTAVGSAGAQAPRPVAGANEGRRPSTSTNQPNAPPPSVSQPTDSQGERYWTQAGIDVAKFIVAVFFFVLFIVVAFELLQRMLRLFFLLILSPFGFTAWVYSFLGGRGGVESVGRLWITQVYQATAFPIVFFLAFNILLILGAGLISGIVGVDKNVSREFLATQGGSVDFFIILFTILVMLIGMYYTYRLAKSVSGVALSGLFNPPKPLSGNVFGAVRSTLGRYRKTGFSKARQDRKNEQGGIVGRSLRGFQQNRRARTAIANLPIGTEAERQRKSNAERIYGDLRTRARKRFGVTPLTSKGRIGQKTAQSQYSKAQKQIIHDDFESKIPGKGESLLSQLKGTFKDQKKGRKIDGESAAKEIGEELKDLEKDQNARGTPPPKPRQTPSPSSGQGNNAPIPNAQGASSSEQTPSPSGGGQGNNTPVPNAQSTPSPRQTPDPGGGRKKDSAIDTTTTLRQALRLQRRNARNLRKQGRNIENIKESEKKDFETGIKTIKELKKQKRDQGKGSGGGPKDNKK